MNGGVPLYIYPILFLSWGGGGGSIFNLAKYNNIREQIWNIKMYEICTEEVITPKTRIVTEPC